MYQSHKGHECIKKSNKTPLSVHVHYMDALTN